MQIDPKCTDTLSHLFQPRVSVPGLPKPSLPTRRGILLIDVCRSSRWYCPVCILLATQALG